MSPKRIALWFLIVSVAASAVLGIIIVLAGSFSELQVKIILTTLTISGASICALASGALWESKRKPLLPLTGVILALLTAVLVIYAIWTKDHGPEFAKFTASAGLLSVATAHYCLLSLAKLARRFGWARTAAFVAVYLLAGFFIYIIYFEPKGDRFVRIVGATSIVVAALTILTPLFHRLSRSDFDEPVPAIAGTKRRLHATVGCPQCGSAQPGSLAEIKCDKCGCRFVVTILDDGVPVGDS
jgi:hypothetical protein